MVNYILSRQVDRYSTNVRFVSCLDIEEVSEWAFSNVDCSKRWFVREEGKSRVENLRFTAYKIDPLTKKTIKRQSATTKLWKNEFLTEKEAIIDFNKYVDAAEKQLTYIETKLREFMEHYKCDISYIMEGDTHGICEDFQYISIEMGGYSFIRIIE